MFRRILLTTMAICILSMNILLAQGRDGFGIGIMVGEPTGISLKLSQPIAAGIAFSISEKSSYHFHLDYLNYVHVLSRSSDIRDRMPLHYGIGGRLLIKETGKDNDTDFIIGVRIPVGLNFLPETLPIDVFIEIVPILNVVPDMDFSMNSAIGARYYF